MLWVCRVSCLFGLIVDVAGYQIDTGLYAEAGRARPEFANVALVTSANWAYRGMLGNWECWAMRHGLRWNVMALDRKMHLALGDRSFLPPSVRQSELSGEYTFRSLEFNKVSCAKVEGVLSLLKKNISVVFSDPDNLLLQDPFRVGEELGDLIANGQSDYIYTINSGRHERNATKRACPRGTNGSWAGEGNTGFYFAKATPGIIRLFKAVLDMCRSNPEIDDQTNFWDAFALMIKGADHKTAHCDRNLESTPTTVSYPARTAQNTLRWCCLSKQSYATGTTYTDAADFALDRVIAYHANFVTGIKGKLTKMKNLPIKGIPLGGLGGCHNDLQQYDQTNTFAAHFVQTARNAGIRMPTET